jgi:hypothetical protein
MSVVFSRYCDFLLVVTTTSQLEGNQSLEKTTNIHQVTDKQSHIKLYEYNITTRRKSQYLEKTTDIHQVTVTGCMSVVFSRYCDFLLVVRLY